MLARRVDRNTDTVSGVVAVMVNGTQEMAAPSDTAPNYANSFAFPGSTTNHVQRFSSGDQPL